MAGATVDVASAYHQFAQSVSSAKYHATLFREPSPVSTQTNKWLQVVVIYLVEAFGFKITGGIYIAPWGRQSQKSTTRASQSLALSPTSTISSASRVALIEYVSAVVKIFGPDGVNMDLVKTWVGGLQAIGWKFGAAWRVRPKARGITKLAHYLFTVIPVGASF